MVQARTDRLPKRLSGKTRCGANLKLFPRLHRQSLDHPKDDIDVGLVRTAIDGLGRVRGIVLENLVGWRTTAAHHEVFAFGAALLDAGIDVGEEAAFD